MEEDGRMELLRLPRRIEKQTDKDLYYLQSFSIYHRRTLPYLINLSSSWEVNPSRWSLD